MAYDHYSYAGHPQIRTPFIDELASQSVRFPATYVSSSCRPTQATLLTGLPEHKHEITYIAGPALGELPTVADRLINAGYSTYQAGKFWEGNPGFRGFTDHLPFDAVNGNVSVGRASIDPVSGVMEVTSSPWFVWFSPRMPHSPHTPPQEYRSLYEGIGLDEATIDYYAMISWFDAVVGALLERIGETTVVILLADNGFEQSGWPEVPADRSKTTSYERGIRTQLLIRHPKQQSTVRIDLAQAEDVTATIIAIAGADYSDLPGRNLLAPAPPNTPAFGSRSTLEQRDSPGILQERWIRLDEWKLVDSEVGEDRLNNLALDPEENVNLIEDPAYFSVQADLRDRLEAWWLE